MRAVESIYEGFSVINDTDRDSEGTNQAIRMLEAIVEKLLPVKVKGAEIQNEMYSAAIELAQQTEKQGFIAGFQYALRMIKEC